MKRTSSSPQIQTTLSDVLQPQAQLKPTERLAKIADLKGAIKQLDAMLSDELVELQKEIELGMLEDFEDEGSFVYENIKVTPVVTRRWQYNTATKKQISAIQEMAQYQGDATQKSTTSLRFTFS